METGAKTLTPQSAVSARTMHGERRRLYMQKLRLFGRVFNCLDCGSVIRFVGYFRHKLPVCQNALCIEQQNSPRQEAEFFYCNAVSFAEILSR